MNDWRPRTATDETEEAGLQVIHILQVFREGIYVFTISTFTKTDDMMKNFTSVYRKDTTLAHLSEIAENQRKREKSWEQWKKRCITFEGSAVLRSSTEPMDTRWQQNGIFDVFRELTAHLHFWICRNKVLHKWKGRHWQIFTGRNTRGSSSGGTKMPKWKHTNAERNEIHYEG